MRRSETTTLPTITLLALADATAVTGGMPGSTGGRSQTGTGSQTPPPPYSRPPSYHAQPRPGEQQVVAPRWDRVDPPNPNNAIFEPRPSQGQAFGSGGFGSLR